MNTGRVEVGVRKISGPGAKPRWGVSGGLRPRAENDFSITGSLYLFSPGYVFRYIFIKSLFLH